MKRSILASILLALFSGLFTHPLPASGLNTPSPLPTGVWIKLNIIFHKPKNDCKTGFGICTDLTWGIEGPSTSGQYCTVQAQINGQNQLILQVTEEALENYENGSSLPNFRNRNSIPLEEPYTLSMAASRALGSPTPVTIRPGTYPLTYSNHTYTVTIQL
jgi:hypothetical protein